jgi:uncharacterized protein YjbI with pentapeptide repeats
MANDEHVALLKQGVAAWNEWRRENPDIQPDLERADLSDADLREANLSEANLIDANLRRTYLYAADFTGADLHRALLIETHLELARLAGANLSKAHLSEANLICANLSGANLTGAILWQAKLVSANLKEANLTGAKLGWLDVPVSVTNDAQNIYLNSTNLTEANLTGANLTGADLIGVQFRETILCAANLTGADLKAASLVNTDLTGADLTDCRIYGVSAWNLKLDGAKQQNLVITQENEPTVTVDNIEVAQFVYLLLHNGKIRDVIDTIGKKGVLLLGRFTEGRITILQRLREELRKRGYLPIIFNFDKPETKNFTETVRLLAGMSRFVIADVTNPRSAPLELQATVPELMVPFRPIIEEGEKPFAMLEDLWIQYRDWVFEPLYYSSPDALIGALDEKIIKPAEIRFAELLARKAEKMKGEHV